MKLLIIAGPYEADRIRKAAVPAGFETVAVEPGESLSGWITASRPDLIVMAPQIVHPDPATALAKVRATPRGRVPIFLVGDAGDEPVMATLADGFFVRPISAEALVQRAREVGGSASGPHPVAGAVAAPVGREPSHGSGRRPRTSEGLGPLRPLVTSAMGSGASVGGGLRPAVERGDRKTDPHVLLAELGAGIDAVFEEELSNVLAVAPVKGAAPAAASAPPVEAAAEAPAVEAPVVEAPVAEAPAKATNGQGDDGRWLERLRERGARVDDGDYFQVLGVERASSDDEIKRAHERVLRDLDHGAAHPAQVGDVAGKLDAIRGAADEALRVLGDAALRRRYAANLE
jgi:hypothetical protein